MRNDEAVASICTESAGGSQEFLREPGVTEDAAVTFAKARCFSNTQEDGLQTSDSLAIVVSPGKWSYQPVWIFLRRQIVWLINLIGEGNHEDRALTWGKLAPRGFLPGRFVPVTSPSGCFP